MDDPQDVTGLLQAWRGGDEQAFDALCSTVYRELRRLAHRKIQGEGRRAPMDATALVHETVLRLVGQRSVSWESRGHFLAIAAKMMRRVLVDHARSRDRQKRGGDVVVVSLEELTDDISTAAKDVLAVHEALEALSNLDQRKGDVVELRFFGGFQVDEVSKILGVSEATVMRDWTLAKAWLKRRMSPA